MTTLETAIVAMLAVCAAFLFLIFKMLKELHRIGRRAGNDIHMILDAAEGIERNVNTIAAPMNSRKQKRFQRRLRRAWPHIMKTLAEVFAKPRRRIVDPPTTTETAANP